MLCYLFDIHTYCITSTLWPLPILNHLKYSRLASSHAYKYGNGKLYYAGEYMCIQNESHGKRRRGTSQNVYQNIFPNLGTYVIKVKQYNTMKTETMGTYTYIQFSHQEIIICRNVYSEFILQKVESVLLLKSIFYTRYVPMYKYISSL